MERLDLGVRGFGEIEDVVALEGLIEERQAQSQDNEGDDDKRAPL